MLSDQERRHHANGCEKANGNGNGNGNETGIDRKMKMKWMQIELLVSVVVGEVRVLHSV